jgi:hypothetical protein
MDVSAIPVPVRSFRAEASGLSSFDRLDTQDTDGDHDAEPQQKEGEEHRDGTA